MAKAAPASDRLTAGSARAKILLRGRRRVVTGQKSGGRYRLRRSAKAISAGHDNDRLACFLRASCTVSKPAFPVAPPVTRRKQRCRKNLMLESAKTSACDTLRHNPWSSRAPKSIPSPHLSVCFFIHCTNLFLSQSLHSPFSNNARFLCQPLLLLRCHFMLMSSVCLFLFCPKKIFSRELLFLQRSRTA